MISEIKKSYIIENEHHSLLLSLSFEVSALVKKHDGIRDFTFLENDTMQLNYLKSRLWLLLRASRDYKGVPNTQWSTAFEHRRKRSERGRGGGGACSRISEKREGEISQKLCNFPDLTG